MDNVEKNVIIMEIPTAEQARQTSEEIFNDEYQKFVLQEWNSLAQLIKGNIMQGFAEATTGYTNLYEENWQRLVDLGYKVEKIDGGVNIKWR